MGRAHTKTVVVVEVVDVLVADGTAGVPLIVVEGTTAQRAALIRSAPPPEGGLMIIAQTSEFVENSEVLGCLLAPAAQNFADLHRHDADMFVLFDGNEFQVETQAKIHLQLTQARICHLQVVRLFDVHARRDERLLKIKDGILDALCQYEALVFGKFLRGRDEPERQVVCFGEDGRFLHNFYGLRGWRAVRFAWQIVPPSQCNCDETGSTAQLLIF